MQVTINTENKEILEYLELLKKEIEQEKEIPEDVMASFLRCSLEDVWEQKDDFLN